MKKQNTNNLTAYGSFIVMRTAIKTAINVLIKIRQNADVSTWAKFTDMIAELQEIQNQLHTGEYKYFETSGDGLQVALLAYDVYCNELKKNDETNLDFVTWAKTKTEHKHIDKRVKIQKLDSAALKSEMLAPCQIAYRACREYIQSHTAPDTRRQKCFYFADLAQIDENGTIYKRLVYTEKRFDDASKEVHADIDYIIESLQLTKIQYNTLTLRLKGYGVKAIATYFGKDKRAVKDTLAQIKKKFYSFLENDVNATYLALIETIVDTENDDDENDDTDTVTDDLSTVTIPEMTSRERYESNTIERERKAKHIAMMIETKNRIAREKVATNIENGLVFPD